MCKTQSLFLFFIIPLLFTSCEKVITVKLNNSKPVLVIDARLTDQNESQVVKISKTTPYSTPNTFNAFSGAAVTLSTPEGLQIPFNEVEPGVYKSAAFQGIPGNKYTLEVSADGKLYSATSEMPQPVALESLVFKKVINNTFVTATYKDPVSLTNKYRYIVKVKNKFELDAVTEDRFTNGKEVSDNVYSVEDNENLMPGDRIDVELQCIDTNVYRYFYSIINPGDVPANPPSNFTNGALGVFNAYTRSEKSIIVE